MTQSVEPKVDPNEGILTMDIPDDVWNQFTPQGQIGFVVHQLIDLMATPHFHAAKGVRIQVRRPGIIFPSRVVAAFGKQGAHSKGVN